VSPRHADREIRLTLIDIAARLLLKEGPQALTTRRIAAEAESSTMAVYTHFGGMSGLVREIVHEGFGRLQAYLTQVHETDDPVADMALLGRAYRHNALANDHLYAVMFGGASLAGFSLADEDRRYGRYTLANVVQCANRCLAAGRFQGDAELIAHQMWTATHGIVTLELGGYLTEPITAEQCFEAQLHGLMTSVGDNPDAAARSVARSLDRVRDEVVAVQAEAPPESTRNATSDRPRPRRQAPVER
jgi:AcrR family transcriptional regulator